ncbi:hypothetical protein MNB_SM-4-1004 [hydrothermal vent metagenome]|uniref:PDZ domain-containing protein n=1 Tax=hydrothermal vent metagenome TaxID=652676 RepID=A0A1W1CIT5_9ZZZZ
MFNLFSSKRTPLQCAKVQTKNFSKTILLQSKAGLLFISIIINNKSYRLLLDTAAFTLFSPQLLEELQCKKTQESVQTLDAFGTQKDMQVYSLDSLEIGGLIFNDFFVICDDFSKNFPLSCLEFDGILGYNLFQNLILDLNFDKKELILSDKLPSTQGYSSTKLLSLNAGVPAFKLQIENKTFEVGIDTGKNDGLMIGDKKFLNYCEQKELQKQRTAGIFSSSFSGLNQFKIINKIGISSFPISYQENAQNMAGTAFLKNFHIIIDFTKRKVYLKKRNEEIKEDFLKSFGFLTFWNKEKKLYISAIVEGSPTYKSRLKIGDMILSINDLDTLNFSQKDYCEFSLLAQKSIFHNTNSVKLTIKRDTKLIQVELNL